MYKKSNLKQSGASFEDRSEDRGMSAHSNSRRNLKVKVDLSLVKNNQNLFADLKSADTLMVQPTLDNATVDGFGSPLKALVSANGLTPIKAKQMPAHRTPMSLKSTVKSGSFDISMNNEREQIKHERRRNTILMHNNRERFALKSSMQERMQMMKQRTRIAALMNRNIGLEEFLAIKQREKMK